MTASTSASTSETAASNTPADTETKTLNHVLRLLPEPATYDSPGLTITTTLSSTSTTTAGSATSTITHAPDSEPNSDPSSAEGSHSGVNKSKLAVALPISIAGLLIIGLVWFYLRRRRRRRDAQPTFDMATSQTTAVSASELMIVPKVATPEPAVSSQPHLPVRDVHPQQSHEPSPGPASARTPHDSNTELGLAVAVPMNRMSLTEYGSRGLGKPNSRVGAGAMGIRLPFRDDDEDAVSVVSGLNEHRNQGHDFDELSSVSSFNDGDDDHHSWN